MVKKVLLSTSTFAVVSDKPLEMLTHSGYETVKNPFGRKLNKAELVSLAGDCVGVVAGTETWDREAMIACPGLKVISRVGVGMDNVDQEFADKQGIIVKNTPYGPTRAVSELALAVTMSVLRKVPQSHLDMKHGVWKKQTGRLLTGKIVGIIGLGKIGKETATIFRSLGNEVVAFDPFFDEDWAGEHGVEFMEMNKLLGISDIVILHLPAGPGNQPVIAKKQLDEMKKGACLINMSRGGVVDEDALYTALKSDKIGGAAIDVFMQEPYVKGPLCTLDNVVLTPHIGSYAAESKLQMEIDAVQNLLDALKQLDKT